MAGIPIWVIVAILFLGLPRTMGRVETCGDRRQCSSCPVAPVRIAQVSFAGTASVVCTSVGVDEAAF